MNYPTDQLTATSIGKGSQVRISADYCQKTVSQSLGLSPDRIYTVQIDHGTRVTVSDEGNTLPSTARRFKKDTLILVAPTIDLETPQDVVDESAQVDQTPVVESPTLLSEEIEPKLQLGKFLETLAPKNGSRELWFKSGHNIFFVTDNWSEKTITLYSTKGTGTDRVRDKLVSTDGYSYLRTLSEQKDSGGVFYIPTQPQGLPLAGCVDSTDDLPCELDDLTRNEQVSLYAQFKSISGLNYSSLLSSGGKSIHGHIKLDRHYPIAEAQYLRRLWMMAMLADTAVVNPHQPMRVPGFFRGDKGSEQALIESSLDKYTFEEAKEGLQKFFTHLNLASPESISDDWWRDLAKIVSNEKISRDEKLVEIRKALLAGHQPKVVKLKPNRVDNPEDSEVLSALNSIDPDIDYKEYLSVLMALHSHNPDLLPDAIEWASKAKDSDNQYRDEADVLKHWVSFKNEGVNVSTLFYHAKKEGWQSADFDWNTESEKLSGEWANLSEAKKTKRLDNLLVEAVPHVGKAEIDLLLTQLGFDIKKEYPRICYAVNIVRTKLRNENRFDEAATFTGGYFWAVLKSHKIEYDYLRLIKKFGANLKYNILKKQVELNGKVIPVGSSIIDLSVDHGFTGESGLQLPDVFLKVARSHSYHPVKDYLDSVADKFEPDSKIIENLAERYLGQSDSIYNRMLCRTLIAAAARIYEPGCKHDTALFLQGKQGFNKSTFFKVLAGGSEYFDDSLGSVSEKDEKLKMHSVWIVEWAELETVFKKKDISSTKAFLSSQVDTLRLPYGRDNESFPRMSIIVGSTNQDEFLSDSTGNRRFWVIPVSKKIDCELLKLERDEIWAAIVHQYRKGVQHWLSDNEEVKAQSVAEAFQTSHPWTQPVIQYASRFESVSTKDILDDALQIEICRQTRADEMTVAAILKQAGWNLTRAMVKGRRSSLWFKP